VMAAWTKGPLVLRDARDRANPEGPFIAPAGGSPTTCLTGYYPAAETAANGALYAAAPDLVAAVRRQVENIERWREMGIPATPEESKSIYEQLLAALTRATGG